MTYRPAKAKPRKRRRQDDIDQPRLDLQPYRYEGKSDLDREVQEHAEQTRHEPLPGQTGLPWEEKPCSGK